MKRPWVTVRLRTVAHDGVVPLTVEVQLLEFAPSVSVAEEDTTGATALMSGATVLDASEAASASVSVEAEPNPPRMPLAEVELPGDTVNRFVPRALISELTWSCAP